MEKKLHVIAFNIPYPANYGGIIDVYYKLKTLCSLGIKITLHCFEYERSQAPELENVCEKVYYYKRNTGLLANMTYLPYNVYSRKNPELITNLLKDDSPILFEGLHSCYYLPDPRLKKRYKIYREANIEHDYYHHLAQSGSHQIKSYFYRIEALRFKWYQRVLKHSNLMLAISLTDADYLRKTFPGKPVEYIPGFHPNESVTSQPGKAEFILYHGKLSVEENELAALYLIREVFSEVTFRCVIAGMNPSLQLQQAATPYQNITLVQNPSESRMNQLVRDAQIHLLVTFQDTGLKLKLVNSLYAGRHIIVNDLMLDGTGLESLCTIANTPQEMIRACTQLMETPFTEGIIQKRQALLGQAFSNQSQGEKLCQIIYGEE